MNDLEKVIMQGAMNAHDAHRTLTGGWWLDRAPESFIQVLVAQRIATLEHQVYIDTSLKKIVQDIGRRHRGRPSTNIRQRPDISVWFKTSDTLRAVIEIKRAWQFRPVRLDAMKLTKYLRQKGAAGTGYLLVYSEINGQRRRVKLRNRFEKWANRLSWTLVGHIVRTSHVDTDWAWGFALMRFVAAK
jgi:hypothetical protein